MSLRWATAVALLCAGCSSTLPPLPASDLHAMPTESIEGDAVWEGEVVIDRIVIIRAGGSLTIRPGTQVRFRRIDWDGDGIGDAEITVEGRLEAVGTAGAPIDLASAEPDPRPGDWKYLHVNFARGATLAHVRIRHAFSGIQVHYSPAEIRNCEFTENVDGVRFSTARLLLTGSRIHRNVNGIRFEERGHPAVVRGNEISDNEVGVFAVTRCSGRSEFRRNNFVGNRYPVKLGWEQDRGLPFPENYWGGAGADEVLGQVLDGREHPNGPAVTLDPVLSEPVALPSASD